MGYRHTASKVKHPLFNKNSHYRPYDLSSKELRIQMALGSLDLNDWTISFCVQRKYNTSSKVLNVFADCEDPSIRWLVSHHPNTSRSTRLRLRKLEVAIDGSAGVAGSRAKSKRNRRKKFRW
ncbi:hypothetical protein LCGC14_1854760 [marine sediment metagenome]|uniref:Uncharacterized protein n=1 Tax=marine sediment metagenome TaxID=412755 RepID=A0A0F9G9Q9_9ZZZZ